MSSKDLGPEEKKYQPLLPEEAESRRQDPTVEPSSQPSIREEREFQVTPDIEKTKRLDIQLAASLGLEPVDSDRLEFVKAYLAKDPEPGAQAMMHRLAQVLVHLQSLGIPLKNIDVAYFCSPAEVTEKKYAVRVVAINPATGRYVFPDVRIFQHGEDELGNDKPWYNQSPEESKKIEQKVLNEGDIDPDGPIDDTRQRLHVRKADYALGKQVRIVITEPDDQIDHGVVRVQYSDEALAEDLIRINHYLNSDKPIFLKDGQQAGLFEADQDEAGIPFNPLLHKVILPQLISDVAVVHPEGKNAVLGLVWYIEDRSYDPKTQTIKFEVALPEDMIALTNGEYSKFSFEYRLLRREGQPFVECMTLASPGMPSFDFDFEG